MTNSNLENGYLWFFCLIIINIIIITFIIGFYNYITSQPGIVGSIGETGFPGLEGDGGSLVIPCYKKNF